MLKRRLQRLIRLYTCQNATLFEISCTGSFGFYSQLVLAVAMVPTVTLAVATVRIQRHHVIERRENAPLARQDGKEKNVIPVSEISGGLVYKINILST